MNFLKLMVYYLVCITIVGLGVVFMWFELHEVYEFIATNLSDNDNVRFGVAVGAIAVGVAGMFASYKARPRQSRKIEFQSRHGYIVIELDSVQASLQKAMSKLPEIKTISLKVYPADNDRKVRIVADAVVLKPPGAGIRETASDLEDKLADAAKRMLGVDDIASLDLKISRVLMNVKKEWEANAPDSNRLLEHQKQAAPAPAAAEPAKAETKPAESASEASAATGPNGEKPADEAADDKEAEPAKSFWRG
jgi:hypothetical protein